jgi:hypothetical protein
MDAAAQPMVIPLWPHGAPGSEDWAQQEQETDAPPPLSITVVRNVTQPTPTAFRPNDVDGAGAE